MSSLMTAHHTKNKTFDKTEEDVTYLINYNNLQLDILMNYTNCLYFNSQGNLL